MDNKHGILLYEWPRCRNGHLSSLRVFLHFVWRTSVRACVQTITVADNHIFGGEPAVTAMPYSTWYKVNESWAGGPEKSYYDYERVTTTSTIFWVGGRAYYPGWSVEWVAEDNATLNPPWPTLTSDMVIPTWVPGAIVSNPGQYHNKGSGDPRPTRLPKSKFDRVGVPLIATLAGILALVLLGTLLFWCIRRRRAKKTLVKAPSEETVLETRN